MSDRPRACGAQEMGGWGGWGIGDPQAPGPEVGNSKLQGEGVVCTAIC